MAAKDFTDEEVTLINEMDTLAWRKAQDEPMTPKELERLGELDAWLDRRCEELYGPSQGLPDEVRAIVDEVLYGDWSKLGARLNEIDG